MTRVRLKNLRDDADWIEAETGHAGIQAGLLGTLVSKEGSMYEVELDRNGERILFDFEELEVLS